MEEAVHCPDINSVLLSHLEAGELRLDLGYWMFGKRENTEREDEKTKREKREI